jgi:malate dehydrogenase (oxaloacetate-decarboxylating)(NADP+)
MSWVDTSASCRRVRGDPYYELLDEFLTAVKRRYGNTTLLQFEDMTYDNASKLLNMYRWVARLKEARR